MKMVRLISALVVACAIYSNSWAAEADYSRVNQWGDESPMCYGHSQSPINIEDKDATLKSSGGAWDILDFPDSIISSEVMNNHAYFKRYTTEFYGVKYKLVQVHFHVGSEHAINGNFSAMEGHFVHEDAKGNLLVVAVLFDVGKSNLAIEQFLQAHERNTQKAAIDFEDLLDEDDFYYYQGSLTTPPCTEGVKWIVLQEREFVTQDQVNRMKALHGGKENNRPAQDRNNRPITRYSDDL